MLKEAILTFAGRACAKLRRLELAACRLQLFILSNRFRNDRPQFSKRCELTLTPPTNDTREVSKLVSQNIDRIWQDGLQVKKAGILLLDLCRPEDAPRDLFSASFKADNPLMQALDQLEGRFGKETVMIGRLARTSSPDWFMTTNNRSPNYTTRWQDIPTLR